MNARISGLLLATACGAVLAVQTEGTQSNLVTFYDMPAHVEALKRNVVSIEVQNAQSQFEAIGTGCCLNPADRVILTCAHVVRSTDMCNTYVGINLANGKKHVGVDTAYVDTIFDLALLVSDSFCPDSEVHADAYKNLLAPDSLLREGTGLLMIGFPLGIGTGSRGDHPITRLGMIAQSVQLDRCFLVDGTANPASSGSPVFLVQRPRRLAGIAKDFRPDLVFRRKGKLVTPDKELAYNSGLTDCVSASAVLSFWERVDSLRGGLKLEDSSIVRLCAREKGEKGTQHPTLPSRHAGCLSPVISTPR